MIRPVTRKSGGGESINRTAGIKGVQGRSLSGPVIIWPIQSVGGYCRCRPIQPVRGGGGGGGGLSLSKRDRSLRSLPGYGPQQGRGSLAMRQIREYKGPQSAFGPDAKYDN